MRTSSSSLLVTSVKFKIRPKTACSGVIPLRLIVEFFALTTTARATRDIDLPST